MNYDFLVAGFPKCGTTTFHNLLIQNPQIYLPKCKETFYVSQLPLYKKGEGYFERKFYGKAAQGQKIGGVEPSFAKYARRVRALIGENTKIIFLVRNPIDYLYSFYRMCMSFGSREWYEAYKMYGGFSEIIKAYVKHEKGFFQLNKENTAIASAIKGGRYIKYIRPYMQMSDSPNIKVLVFERFVKNEAKVMEDIFDFIDVQQQKVDIQVSENKSEAIMPKNNIDRWLLEKREYLHHTYIEQRKDIRKSGMILCEMYYKYIPKIASKHIDDQIDSTARKLLRGYYDQSVRELQEMTGLDLMEEWGWST